MKLLIPLALFASVAFSQASNTISTTVGILRDSSSTIVNDTSLWAIVYDQDNSGTFAGGLELNSSLASADSSLAQSTWSNATITAGLTIGGDRILYVFEVDSANTSGVNGVAGSDVDFDYTAQSLTAGRNWAIYWFPGLTTASNTLPSTNFQIGGIHENSLLGGGSDTTMSLPSGDGLNLTLGVYDNVDLSGEGGQLPVSRLTAINATSIPEPSSTALGLLGLAGACMVRRRRD